MTIYVRFKKPDGTIRMEEEIVDADDDTDLSDGTNIVWNDTDPAVPLILDQ